jgi:hypothetical protein
MNNDSDIQGSGDSESYKGEGSDKRIWLFMALDEIINLNFGSSSIYFPRELKLYIMSLYPERFIIEEAYRGVITMRGLKLRALQNRTWSRSNQIYAYHGLKLKYTIENASGSSYGMGITVDDIDDGMKKFGYGSIENQFQNGLFDLFFYRNDVVFGFNPDEHRVDGTKKPEEFQEKIKWKPERGFYDIVRANNDGKRRCLKYFAPRIKEIDLPVLAHHFELNFSVDECKNTFVSFIIGGKNNTLVVQGRYLVPKQFCIFFGNYTAIQIEEV